ncbi:cell division protein FtsB [Bordetella genomosp. 9]|uniref:Cell division protein FtsB n=1 Tax=Bordetella genomosp. 9 TaxID=1416803 RepID=A0A1W6Z1P3_9BORD|nr:cell division protein FtsB [Bordetella genomosp. 9]ARP87292.1 cell division protein FtsB [Bordetella genomosp. 9]ARP91279.1 cell division protein FtsB [Bordetella genomosp. 9]
MRLLFLVLLALVCLIQYPLWFGKGGWFKVWDLQKQVAAQRAVNEGMRARNAALDAEVRDLQTGTGAIEERARSELGMMKDGEVFVQIVPKGENPPPNAQSAGAVRNATAVSTPGPAGAPRR